MTIGQPTCTVYRPSHFVVSQPGRDHRRYGPIHIIAGYHDTGTSAPAFLFGDYATACGLRLPHFPTNMSSEIEWLPTTVRCGDCFPSGPTQRE